MAFRGFPPEAEFDDEFAIQLVINDPIDCWGIAYGLATWAITSNLPVGRFSWTCESSGVLHQVLLFIFRLHLPNRQTRHPQSIERMS